MQKVLHQLNRILRNKTITVMKQTDRMPFFSWATFLMALSIPYSSIVRLRRALYCKGLLASAQLPCTVISVGNITVGGTGKTPMTMYLAQLVQSLGYNKVVIISRGYKGLAEQSGAIVSDGRTIMLNVRQAGDEPYLIANLLDDVPVIVGRNRYAAGMLAMRCFQPDVIILDDAFQHLQLKRDLNLALLDAQAPFGNTFMLPRGPLREPTSVLKYADAVVLTRSENHLPGYFDYLVRAIQPRPVFRAFYKPVLRCVVPAQTCCEDFRLSNNMASESLKKLAGKRFFTFSGLAHNDTFWSALKESGGYLQETLGFDDHHYYTSEEMKQIAGAAIQSSVECLVTTDKDYVRIPQDTCLPLDLMVLGLSLDVNDSLKRWRTFIGEHLN